MVPAERAVLDGLAPDGGLYVPERFPSLPEGLLDPGAEALWADISFAVLEPFLPSFPRDGLRAAVDRASACFPGADAAPLAFAGDRPILELFHGPTLAFKDVALSLMGGLLDLSRRAAGDGKELLVLTATSGDTGKAALSGLAGLAGLRVLVFYPAEGVSGVQRLQMLTHAAAGASVVGVRGNFDDAQRGVKAL
ncbi:MAG: threonine synthase, partial [Spirochaetaceae bacterium]|nr:threonine synthase [Spirochaetaceae bacterium]